MFGQETVRNERTFIFRSGFKQTRLINGRKSVSSVTRKGNACKERYRSLKGFAGEIKQDETTKVKTLI